MAKTVLKNKNQHKELSREYDNEQKGYFYRVISVFITAITFATVFITLFDGKELNADVNNVSDFIVVLIISMITAFSIGVIPRSLYHKFVYVNGIDREQDVLIYFIYSTILFILMLIGYFYFF